MERWEEARTTCLSYDEIVLAATYYSDWSKIQIWLHGQGLIENTRDLRYQFHSLLDKLIGKDALRVAFQVGERLIQLCVAANESLRANYVIEIMKSIVEGLHRDLGASDKLKELERRVSKMESIEVSEIFDSVEALLDHPFETETQESVALNVALKKWPDNGDLYARKSDLFDVHFRQEDAYGFLEAAYKEHRGSAALESRYGSAYLKKHGFEAYKSEFPIDAVDGLTLGAIWNRGFNYVSQFDGREPKKALDALKVVEVYWPKDIWLLGRIARQEMELGHYDKAISYRRKQIQLDPEDKNHKWDLLVVATLKQDTSLICEMGEELNIELEDTGQYPSDKRRRIRLQWNLKSGYTETYQAIRLGPALARITSICRVYDEHQLYGRDVVFSPTPLNQLDQKDDEGYLCDIEGNYSFLYPPPLLTLHDPNYRTYTLDGLRPSDDDLKTLSEMIKAAGFIYHVWSTDAYVLSWIDEEAERIDPAIYIYILINAGEENKLNDILIASNEKLKHPLIWSELTKVLGDEKLRLQQNAIAEKYGIES